MFFFVLQVFKVPVVISATKTIDVVYSEQFDNWDFNELHKNASENSFTNNLISSIPFWVDLSIGQYLFSNKLFNFIQKTHSDFGLAPISLYEDDGMILQTYYFKNYITLSIGAPDVTLRNRSKLLERPSNIHYSGFVPDKKLYQSLQKGNLIDFIDQSDLPVIYVNINPKKTVDVEQQFKVFSDLDSQDFFKFVVLLPNETKNRATVKRETFANVFMTSYVPQGSVLLHHKVKAFLTDCEIDSVQDSIYAVKPLITFSQSRTQKIIAHRIIQNGIGLPLQDFSPDAIIQSLQFAFYEEVHNTIILNLKHSRIGMMGLGGFAESARIVEKTAQGLLKVENVSHLLGITSSELYLAICLQIMIIKLLLFFALYTCYKMLRKVVGRKMKTQ